jgi:hypothetical protein
MNGRAHRHFCVAAGVGKSRPFLQERASRIVAGVAYYANKAPAALIFELYLRRVPVISQYDLRTWLTALVKAGNFLIYCAVLLFFWKKDERPTAMVYELVTLALVTILISPVSWRHHYLLTLIPIIYLWVRLGQRWRDILALAAATPAMGKPVFPDYVIVASFNPVLSCSAA